MRPCAPGVTGGAESTPRRPHAIVAISSAYAPVPTERRSVWTSTTKVVADAFVLSEHERHKPQRSPIQAKKDRHCHGFSGPVLHPGLMRRPLIVNASWPAANPASQGGFELAGPAFIDLDSLLRRALVRRLDHLRGPR